MILRLSVVSGQPPYDHAAKPSAVNPLTHPISRPPEMSQGVLVKQGEGHAGLVLTSTASVPAGGAGPPPDQRNITYDPSTRITAAARRLPYHTIRSCSRSHAHLASSIPEGPPAARACSPGQPVVGSGRVMAAAGPLDPHSTHRGLRHGAVSHRGGLKHSCRSGHRKCRRCNRKMRWYQSESTDPCDAQIIPGDMSH